MGTISAQMRVSILNGLACAEFTCQLVLGVQCTDNTKIIDSTNKAQAHTVYTKTQRTNTCMARQQSNEKKYIDSASF